MQLSRCVFLAALVLGLVLCTTAIRLDRLRVVRNRADLQQPGVSCNANKKCGDNEKCCAVNLYSQFGKCASNVCPEDALNEIAYVGPTDLKVKKSPKREVELKLELQPPNWSTYQEPEGLSDLPTEAGIAWDVDSKVSASFEIEGTSEQILEYYRPKDFWFSDSSWDTEKDQFTQGDSDARDTMWLSMPVYQRVCATYKPSIKKNLCTLKKGVELVQKYSTDKKMVVGGDVVNIFPKDQERWVRCKKDKNRQTIAETDTWHDILDGENGRVWEIRGNPAMGKNIKALFTKAFRGNYIFNGNEYPTLQMHLVFKVPDTKEKWQHLIAAFTVASDLLTLVDPSLIQSHKNTGFMRTSTIKNLLEMDPAKEGFEITPTGHKYNIIGIRGGLYLTNGNIDKSLIGFEFRSMPSKPKYFIAAVKALLKVINEGPTKDTKMCILDCKENDGYTLGSVVDWINGDTRNFDNQKDFIRFYKGIMKTETWAAFPPKNENSKAAAKKETKNFEKDFNEGVKTEVAADQKVTFYSEKLAKILF